MSGESADARPERGSAGADRHDSCIDLEALPDIETTADCERLVRDFYGKAMVDAEIGWIFTDVAQLDLEEHIR